MTKPIRLQLSRRKGANLQAALIEVNGLPAINVARPSAWGNPYRVGAFFTAAEAVEAFRERWDLMLASTRRQGPARKSLDALRGRNLACWCKPGEPCHANILLELANVECVEVTPSAATARVIARIRSGEPIHMQFSDGKSVWWFEQPHQIVPTNIMAAVLTHPDSPLREAGDSLFGLPLNSQTWIGGEGGQ